MFSKLTRHPAALFHLRKKNIYFRVDPIAERDFCFILDTTCNKTKNESVADYQHRSFGEAARVLMQTQYFNDTTRTKFLCFKLDPTILLNSDTNLPGNFKNKTFGGHAAMVVGDLDCGTLTLDKKTIASKLFSGAKEPVDRATKTPQFIPENQDYQANAIFENASNFNFFYSHNVPLSHQGFRRQIYIFLNMEYLQLQITDYLKNLEEVKKDEKYVRLRDACGQAIMKVMMGPSQFYRIVGEQKEDIVVSPQRAIKDGIAEIAATEEIYYLLLALFDEAEIFDGKTMGDRYVDTLQQKPTQK